MDWTPIAPIIERLRAAIEAAKIREAQIEACGLVTWADLQREVR